MGNKSKSYEHLDEKLRFVTNTSMSVFWESEISAAFLEWMASPDDENLHKEPSRQQNKRIPH